jgi:triacylglycerol lipase
MHVKRLGIVHAVLAAAAAAQAGGLAPGRSPMPWTVFDAAGRPVPAVDVMSFEDRYPETRQPGEPALHDAMASLVPFAPSQGEKRRGLFSRFFGMGGPQPTPPPLLTKYPIVLVHGANNPKVTKLGKLELHYFARTEAHLRSLNLRLLVPEVNPFGSIEERAMELKAQIEAAIPEGKFNILGHSMGGLDARYLASRDPIGERIASITTVSTPHYGSWYADFAKKWVFERQGLNKLGGLVEHMAGEFNAATPDNPNVSYFSYGTATSPWRSPLFYWGMNLISRISEQRAARRRAGPGAPGSSRWASLPEEVPAGVRSRHGAVRFAPSARVAMAEVSSKTPADWVIPKWAGRNDGVVSLSSSVWGTYKGTVKTHHWGPMGWVSFFPEQKFWEEVVRRLAADGF